MYDATVRSGPLRSSSFQVHFFLTQEALGRDKSHLTVCGGRGEPADGATGFLLNTTSSVRCPRENGGGEEGRRKRVTNPPSPLPPPKKNR